MPRWPSLLDAPNVYEPTQLLCADVLDGFRYFMFLNSPFFFMVFFFPSLSLVASS